MSASPGVRDTTWAPQRSTVLDFDVIPARESGRFGLHAEIGRVYRVGIDPVGRKAIPMHRLNCCSGALRALASLGVCLHVCQNCKT